MKQVGIIGAGISGITTAYHLSKRGVDFEMLEADEGVGGVWRQKVYKECFLITSRDSTNLPDSRQPADYPDFPSAKLFLDYIRRFAEDKGVSDRVVTSARVTSAKPINGYWQVETEVGSARRYENLVVCSGLNQRPNWADISGTFDGELLHSGDYRGGEQLRDKRVLVVGGGNSAFDIAAEAGRSAKRSAIAMRSGRWLVPKYSMGIPLTDFQGNAPFWAQKLFIRFLIHMHTGPLPRVGLPAPSHPMFEQTMVMNQQLPYMLEHGLVDVFPGVKRYAGSSVEFADGRTEAFDTVVHATGFRPDVSFIDATQLRANEKGPWIHRRLFSPKHTNLFVNGFYINNGAFTQVANVAAELIAACIANPNQASRVVADDMLAHPDQLDFEHVIENRKSHIEALRRLIAAVN